MSGRCPNEEDEDTGEGEDARDTVEDRGSHGGGFNNR